MSGTKGAAHFNEKAKQNPLGRIDSLGVRDYATEEGVRGSPRAIIRSHYMDNQGNVQSQNNAYDYKGLEKLAVETRAELANPNNSNPHSADNLASIQKVYKELHTAIKTDQNLGYGVTPADLQNVTALDRIAEDVRRMTDIPKVSTPKFDMNGIY